MSHAGGGFVVTGGSGGEGEPGAVCVEDTFDRTVSNGWGSAGMGLEWKPILYYTENLGAYSVHNGYAQFDPEASQGPPGGDDGLAALPNQLPSGWVEVDLSFSIENTTTNADYEQEPQFYITRHLWGETHISWYWGLDCWFDWMGPGSYVTVFDPSWDNDLRWIDPPAYGEIVNVHLRWEGGRVEAVVSWGSASYTMGIGSPVSPPPDTESHGAFDTFYIFVQNMGQSFRLHSFRLCSAACDDFTRPEES